LSGQKPEAQRRAKSFREERIPKFLGWFERILARNPEGAGQLVGSALTYADLSLFQIVEGLALSLYCLDIVKLRFCNNCIAWLPPLVYKRLPVPSRREL
jgi:glutathione S-transferase